MQAALRLFYDRIITGNLQRIPARGPALLIANHPSSLMDAALLGILLKRPIHFFARGDIFINPLVTRILHALHMHPVHHHQAGRHTLKANDDAFAAAQQLLAAGEMVLFFPEGSSHVDYTLHPFKKGAFRIALQTIDAFPIQLPIVPIGINYSHPTRIFSRVWVHAGEPITANQFLERYRQHAPAGIKGLTDAGYDAVAQLVLHQPAIEPESFFLALTIWRNSNAGIAAIAQKNIIEQELALCRIDPQLWQEAAIPLSKLDKDLQRTHITPAQLAAAELPRYSTAPLWIGLPAACIGWLLNALPLLIARIIADRKVTRIDFYSWILVSTAALLWIFWMGILLIPAFIFWPLWKTLLLLLAIVATGQYSWQYFAYYDRIRLQNLSGKMKPEDFKQLQQQWRDCLYNLPFLISSTTAGSSRVEVSPS